MLKLVGDRKRNRSAAGNQQNIIPKARAQQAAPEVRSDRVPIVALEVCLDREQKGEEDETL